MAKETSKNILTSKETPKKQKKKDINPGALGIGDAYAYGVKDLVEKMKSEQGSSQTQWLGVAKQSFDAKECVDRQKLHSKDKK